MRVEVEVLPLPSVPTWLIPYQPRLAIDALVEQINLIYHSFDASHYDSDIVEMRRTWPALWTEMLQQLPPRNGWRILDFGCGTGFATEQALRFLDGRISLVMAYDPSLEMLSRARRKINDPRVRFTSTESTLWERTPFNLLMTNSVLHHLPGIPDFRQYVNENAYWLVGNEPSTRFYSNPKCLRVFREYAEHQERMKWFHPSRYIGKLKSMLRRDSLSKTAYVAYDRGLFGIRPHPDVISRLVDFQAQHAFDDRRGFEPEALQTQGWKLIWSKSYAFLGSSSELRAPGAWRKRAATLQAQFPDDGASFCAVFTRAGFLNGPALCW